MLTNNRKMLEKARKQGYAMPAFNTQGGNYDIIWSICKTAEEMQSPVILPTIFLPEHIQDMTGLFRWQNGVPTRYQCRFQSILTTETALIPV